MKIAIVGGTGFAGAKIAAEAAERKLGVVAISGHPPKAPIAGVNYVQANAFDEGSLTKAVAGCDAIVNAYCPPKDTTVADAVEKNTTVAKNIVAAARANKINRIVAVGGGGSLKVDGKLVKDLPDFPDAYQPSAQSTYAAGTVMLESGLDVSIVCPPFGFDEGPATHNFRVGDQTPLTKADGSPTTISNGDLAVAIVNELEKPEHVGQRYNVGY